MEGVCSLSCWTAGHVTAELQVDKKGPSSYLQVNTHLNSPDPSQQFKEEKVLIDIADLCKLHDTNKQLLQYTNVLCHTTDILLQLAKGHMSADSEDVLHIEDTFKVAMATLENTVALQIVAHMSHAV